MNDHGERAPFLAVLLIVAWAVAGVLYACSLTGCASVRDGQVEALNASADFVVAAEQGLAEVDRREQQDCIDRQSDPKLMAECAAKVRAKYRAAWDAYRVARTAWIATSAEVQAYDLATKSGGKVDPVKMQAAGARLADAVTAFARTMPALAEAK